MEENVALDSNKQKQFVKSIKGIKKLLKKSRDDTPKVLAPVASPKVLAPAASPKAKKRRIKQRGLVYLSHIPHGFYEHQMTQYFKQFGKVTNARVIRSKRTGRSKGCAFVEFGEPAVAQIVAETMNNYLMGKRLIKAAYVPPEKQRQQALRKHWSVTNNPGVKLQQKIKKSHNETKTEEGDLKRAQKIMANLTKTKDKLKDMGIDYDFFSPVDVPEKIHSKKHVEEVPVKSNKKDKKAEVKTNNKKEVKQNNKDKKLDKNKVKENKKPEIPAAKVQAGMVKKQEKLKDSKVKPIEEFIKIAKSDEDDDDDDSSVDFDSDEFEKALEFESGSELSGSDNDDSDVSDDESNVSDDDDDAESDDGDSSMEELPRKPTVKAGKAKKAVEKELKPVPKQNKKAAKDNKIVAIASKPVPKQNKKAGKDTKIVANAPKPLPKQNKKPSPPEQKILPEKRKTIANGNTAPKKAKFEKKGKPSKTFKKK